MLAPPRNVVAGKLDAAVIEAHRAGDAAEERALARTVRAHDHDKLPRWNRERDPIDRADDRPTGRGERDRGIAEGEHGEWLAYSSPRRRA
jgi:hypothetical protein